MKYLYLISIFFAINLKNLSAYQEITIQKDSNLQNYQELLLRINNSITEENIISSIEKNIYNINFSNNQISLSIDIDNLSKDLYSLNIKHNLFFIDCTIQQNFFKFNNKFKNCPNFIIKNFENDSYIYLNHNKKYFRLIKFSKNIDLKFIWFDFLEKNKNSYQLSIDPSNYKKLKYFTGLEPKILSYEQNKIILNFENFYNDKQINFLVNFF